MKYEKMAKDKLIRLNKEKDAYIKNLESRKVSSSKKVRCYPDPSLKLDNKVIGESINCLEHSPVCTKIVDLDLKLRYMSRAGIEALKIDDVSDYYGRPYPFSFFPENFQIKMNDKLKIVIKTGEIIDFEGAVADIYGNQLWFHCTLVPVKDNEGQIDYIIVVSIPITDRKKAESEKTKILNKFFQASKLVSLGELAAGVGHEINNPLTVGIGNLKRIKKVLTDEKYQDQKNDVYRYIEKVNMAHERIRDIVDGLRIYSRADNKVSKITSVRLAVEQTLDFVSEIYRNEGVKITKEFPNEPLSILGNLGKLQQIIMNLISNAKDASEGKEDRQIHLTLKKGQNNTLTFSVRDNGSGISKENREKILEPFFTTKEVGKGTGMGLGLVTKYLEEMDGALTIESKVNEGSTFTAILPLTHDDKLIQERNSKKEKNGKEIAYKLSGTALVVDDDKFVRELIVECLNEFGLKVEQVDNGFTALTKLQEKDYDYVCTDMKMPGMEGDEFIEEARKVANKKTKYFIVTGGVATDFPSYKKLKDKDLADGFIYKPFTEETIFEALSGISKKKNQ